MSVSTLKKRRVRRLDAQRRRRLRFQHGGAEMARNRLREFTRAERPGPFIFIMSGLQHSRIRLPIRDCVRVQQPTFHHRCHCVSRATLSINLVRRRGRRRDTALLNRRRMDRASDVKARGGPADGGVSRPPSRGRVAHHRRRRRRRFSHSWPLHRPFTRRTCHMMTEGATEHTDVDGAAAVQALINLRCPTL